MSTGIFIMHSLCLPLLQKGTHPIPSLRVSRNGRSYMSLILAFHDELFLDIESAPNMEIQEFFAAKREIESGSLTRQSDPARYWKYSVGALNPYEGKAIFIAYRISSIGHIRRLKEWEDGEEAILKKLYDTIRTVKNGRLEFVGHNICGFDLPFLYGRMIHHKIEIQTNGFQNLSTYSLALTTISYGKT